MKAFLLKYGAWAGLGLLVLFIVSRIFFPPLPQVDVVRVSAAPATQVLAVVGRAAPVNAVDVRPEVTGRVVEFLVDEGDVVAAGQVLGVIDAGEQLAATARANADVQARIADASARGGEIAGRQGDVARQLGEVSARRGELAQRQSDLAARTADVARFEADLAGKRATLDLARRDLQRVQTLTERGFASRAALDSAQASVASAQAGVQTGLAAIGAARAGVEAARAAVVSAQGGIAAAQGAVSAAKASVSSASATARAANASVGAARAGALEASTRSRRSSIIAPLAGTILTRPVDTGQFVDSSTTLFRIGSGGAPEIETEIDEADADKLRVGMGAILSPTGANARIEGAITEIAPEVNAATGGRIVRLVPRNTFQAFPPGRTIDVNLIVAKRDNALIIPRSAVVGGRFVSRVDGRGRVAQVEVDLLDWSGDQVAINSGLKSGDVIVVDPQALGGKERIKPIETARQSGGKP